MYLQSLVLSNPNYIELTETVGGTEEVGGGGDLFLSPLDWNMKELGGAYIEENPAVTETSFNKENLGRDFPGSRRASYVAH